MNFRLPLLLGYTLASHFRLSIVVERCCSVLDAPRRLDQLDLRHEQPSLQITLAQRVVHYWSSGMRLSLQLERLFDRGYPLKRLDLIEVSIRSCQGKWAHSNSVIRLVSLEPTAEPQLNRVLCFDNFVTIVTATVGQLMLSHETRLYHDLRRDLRFFDSFESTPLRDSR